MKFSTLKFLTTTTLDYYCRTTKIHKFTFFNSKVNLKLCSHLAKYNPIKV